MIPTWHGHLSDTGFLVLDSDERDARRAYLWSLAGDRIEVTYRKARSQRTLEQNAYWHAVPFPMLAAHFQCSMDAVKLLVLGECFGWMSIESSPYRIWEMPYIAHTANLTAAQGGYLTDWMIKFGLDRGVTIPPPTKDHDAG